MKNDAKFEDYLTCRFKIDMGNLINIDQSTWKSQNWDFDEILLSKVYIVWAKKVQMLKKSFITLKSDTKFGKESTCRCKIDMRNLTNFDQGTRKSQKFYL